jgi:hypothetical protein
MKTILLAFLVTNCAVAATADVLYPAALTFEIGYAFGPQPPFPYQTYQALGAPLTLVGRVAAVGRPFDDLLPPGAYELTYVFEGSTCVEVGNFDDLCSGGEYAVFRGGTVTIYLDTTPDADFTSLSTFRDGDLTLIAEMSFMYVAKDDPFEACPWMPDNPDVPSWFTFVGGIWFDRVSNNGDGFEAAHKGELYFDVPPELQPLGYVCGIDGVVDIDGPVVIQSSTWGAVKALYR